MQLKNIVLLAGVASLTAAAEIDNDDIPAPCRQVCNPLVALAAQCDRDNNDNDQAELACICNAQGTAEQLPICEACVFQYDTDDDNDDDRTDNDVNDLLRSCNLQTLTTPFSGPTGTSSINPASATLASSVSTTITGASTTQTTAVAGGVTNTQPSSAATVATAAGSGAAPTGKVALGAAVAAAGFAAALL